MNPRIAVVARPARAVTVDTRVAVVAETLRVSPYRAVAIVGGNQELLGLATEADVLRLLMSATDVEARARVRESPIGELMTAPAAVVLPHMRASETADVFARTGADTLPVVDSYNHYLGLIAPSDLVQDLVRPFRPPTVGGMATPLGVYLTTGSVSGGARPFALVLTGLLMCLCVVTAQAIGVWGLQGLMPLVTAAVGPVSLSVREGLTEFVPYLFQTLLFLVLLRLSPIAGYHAAEHQVVHAIERAEPLLVENVRAMPRVHPRCGTNLVAGVTILFGGGTLLTILLGGLGPIASLGYGLSLAVALAYWRTVGGWLQEHFTTRPATDAQIESGIRAARELLHRHGSAPFAPQRPLARLWRMGFLQILGGFLLGYTLLSVVLWAVPPLHKILSPFLGDVLLF